MANPGPYPMGQPMGPQNMGGPPMGHRGMMPRPPMRQGTSKIVPVVVSAGLAVGVFCGLLFGVGTGKHSEAAPEKATNNVKRADDSFTPESMANPNVKIPDKNAPKGGSNAAVAKAGSADAAGSNAAAEIKPTKLIVEIKPEAAAQSAKVFVDGKQIEGMSADIPLDPGTTKKTVKVVVKAASYKDIDQEVDVEGESVTVKLELSKGRSTATTSAAPSGTSGTAGAGDGGNTAAATGAGGGSHSGGATTGGNTGGGNAGGGNTSGGGKASGGTKSNTNGNTGKTGKTGKGSGGLIDI
jgi:hypothetical protein